MEWREVDLTNAEREGVETLNAEITQLMTARTGALRLLAILHGVRVVASVSYSDGKLLYTTPPEEREQP